MQLGGPGSQRAQQWMERQLQDLQEDVNHETQVIPNCMIPIVDLVRGVYRW
jgi:hypothetical protein